jgi:hypothetical protein
MAKGDSLYDNKRSDKGESSGGKKVTETKKVTEEKPAEKKAEEPAEPEPAVAGDKAPEGGESSGGEKAEKGEDNGVSEMLSGFKKLLAQHEAERRDHHNNDKEARRMMGNRHAKALKDHFDLAAPKMDAGGADAAPEAAGQVPAGTPGQQA